ncbi:plasmid mobilization relaxosome protein MobC [Catenulispora rubra]|uniref:plasmid mobilization relaxosome protein MobC n=1 Tax=Catenulispora rubra TaxID=280293 RepID=UPI0018925841|nr:plasmid mobilization relaxosome protein MobC [Catenulispora rubra]
MTAPEQPAPRPRKPVRRTRVAGGRGNQVNIGFTNDEYSDLSARANRLGISVPRMLHEKSLENDPAAVPERRQHYRELIGIRLLLARLSTNVNQLARHANSTGQFKPETGAALAAVVRAAQRVEAQIAQTTPPPALTDEEGDEP